MNNLIYKKMSDVMKDIGAVSKDQKNIQQNFKFRGIDQFINALYPALTKHGVFMCPRVTSVTSERHKVQRSSGKEGIDTTVNLLVEYDFFAEDGSKVTVGPVAAEGLDSGDKATNKALSGALKYALMQTFSIPTADVVDQDSDSPEHGTRSSTVPSIVGNATTGAATNNSTTPETSFTKATSALVNSLSKEARTDLVEGLKPEATRPSPFKRSRPVKPTTSSEDII